MTVFAQLTMVSALDRLAMRRVCMRFDRLALNIVLPVIIRFGTATLSFALTSLLTSHLGADRYGMWVVILSVATFATLIDLGSGSAAVTQISASLARDDARQAREIIASLYVIILVAGVVFSCALAISSAVVSWPKVFDPRGVLPVREFDNATHVAVAFVIASVWVGIVQRFLVAQQKSYVSSVWQLLASAASILGVMAATMCGAGFGEMIVAYYVPAILVGVVCTIRFLAEQNRIFLPQPGDVSPEGTARLLRAGLPSLLLRMVGIATAVLDPLAIAYFLDAATVAKYTVADRMFSVVTLLGGIMLAPLWPAYSDALAQGKTQFIRRAFGGSLLWSAVSSAALAAMIFWHADRILAVWVPSVSAPDVLVLAGLSIQKVLESIGIVFSMFLTGVSAMRIQVLTAGIFLTFSATLKPLLMYYSGLGGAVWCNVLVQLLCVSYLFIYSSARLSSLQK